jgi:hypothetical protein
LTDGLGLTEFDIEMFVDVDCNGQRGAAAGQRMIGPFTDCEEVLKENDRSFSG